MLAIQKGQVNTGMVARYGIVMVPFYGEIAPSNCLHQITILDARRGKI
jgi:hypothetical protein